MNMRTTLRGLKRGYVHERSTKVNCIVICTTLPLFLLSGSMLRIAFPAIILCSRHLIEIVKSISTESSYVSTIEDFANGQTDWSMSSQIDVALIQGNLTNTLIKILNGLNVRRLIVDRLPRRLHKTWILRHLDIEHSSYGGVTTAKHRFYVGWYHDDVVTLLNPVHMEESRDASTIQDDSIWCYKFKRKPRSIIIEPLRCVNLGSSKVPVYHIGGLLPVHEIYTCSIVCPTRGSNEHNWGLRKLSRNEIYNCFDMDLSMTSFLSNLMTLLQEALHVIPARSWMAALGHLFDLSSGSSSVKRQRTQEPQGIQLGINYDSLFSHLRERTEDQKAVKADDASTNVKLWSMHLLNEGGPLFQHVATHVPSLNIEAALDTLRNWCLVWWKRNVIKEFNSYLRLEHTEWCNVSAGINNSKLAVWTGQKYAWRREGKDNYALLWERRASLANQDWMKGSDAVRRALKCTWWDWEAGSAPFFWRWPRWYRTTIRDGIAFPFIREPPTYMKSQRRVMDKVRHELICAKLRSVVGKGYIGPGPIKSLTSFFDVPKGDHDIRMVYDGTVNGFNDSIEVPKFGMPTLRSHLRAMGPGYHMVDADVGECFLNFHLHTTLRPYVGVDLSHYLKSQSGKQHHWMCWHRAGMGLKSSPSQACQGMMVAEEVMLGDRQDSANPFRWDVVRMNLPGMKDYDPSLPWVSKVRLSDGAIAADIFIYVDDLRITGLSKEEAWRACHRISSILCWLGLQDATRKRRDSSRTAGAWAGSVVHTTENEVFVLVTKEKWVKAKQLLVEVKSKITHTNIINKNLLEQVRGFLNYVALTYPILLSHLMGFHLTIDGWRRGRDADGWRCLESIGCDIDQDPDAKCTIDEDSPKEVEVKSRLRVDVDSLLELMQDELPPLRRVRSRTVSHVLYGFGDASGSAFGSTLTDGKSIYFEYGQWCTTESEESSNWRELNNLVQTIAGWTERQDIMGSQVFVFTDNIVAECAFWKGTSKSRKLFELILQLKRCALRWSIDLHVIHISGKRMQQQGTDGLSRGEHGTGVMSGMDMTTFIPLHLSPCAREPGLKRWIDSVTNGLNFGWLTHEDWFDKAQREQGNFIWDVEPAAGDVVYELIDKSRLKRPKSMHLVMIPRIATGQWRRIMTRRNDCYIKIDWEPVWPTHIHFEPLLVFISIPFNVEMPFGNRKDRLLERFQGVLQGCKVSSASDSHKRNLLRQFLASAREIPSLQ